MNENARRPVVPKALRAAWVINIAGLVIAGFLMGGVADPRDIHGDHYFLRNHSQLTEVSRGAFWYMYWHGIAALANSVLLILAWVAYGARRRSQA